MTEPSRRARVIAHNPALLSRDEVIALFVARRPLLERLAEDLRRAGRSSTQHHLVIGRRGMGKTLLLHRLRCVVEDDPELARRWLPLVFPEEQYNVSRLSDLWESCLDALIDAIERQGGPGAAELERARKALAAEDPLRARQALELLTSWVAAHKRGLVLLLDNVDLVLGRLPDDHWAIRDLLSTERRLVIVGTSSGPVQPAITYGDAFYDFFKIHELGGLAEAEARSLIETLDRPDGRVARILNEDPGRLRSLHLLTAGNPRALVLLHEVLAMGSPDARDVGQDLEQLLDKHTPLCRARLEALSPQAQQVVHALAWHWDPITAGDLAAALRLEVNIVSSQLSRLVKEGVVEKVEYPGSRAGFQVAERLFNLWHLMRAGRRGRRRLVWLVQFLRLHYGAPALERRELGRIDAAESTARRAVARHPDSLRHIQALALVLARRGTWAEALTLARRFIGAGTEAFHEETWPDTVLFFADIVNGGHASDAATLLEEMGYQERWRPLHVALAAAAARSRAPLLRVAPEVRKPAEDLLARLGIELD